MRLNTSRVLISLGSYISGYIPLCIKDATLIDPTCGSAGMLISCIAYLKAQGKEWRNLHLYGQEINQLTSAIGRMNLFLHGIEDFHIVNDDTLKSPAFIEGGTLKQFDLVLANPPYSIKQWDRGAFENDKYGRNFLGTPPQGRADYAFFQHILKSLKPNSGRCAILFPHGVLFRDEENEMRKKLVESDLPAVVQKPVQSPILPARLPAHLRQSRKHDSRNRRNNHGWHGNGKNQQHHRKAARPFLSAHSCTETIHTQEKREETSAGDSLHG